MSLNIIGAGIGGLTAGVVLKSRNVDFQILEQAKELKPVGAGIILANNAMQIYDRLGLREEIESCGNRVFSMNLVDHNLKPFSSIDLKYFEDKYGVQNIAIHRAKLQQILISKLNGHVKLNHQLQKIEKSTDGYNLYFENQEKLFAKNIIGADGLNSTVRNVVTSKAQIRDSNQTCWRGVADIILPKKYQQELNESWGYGRRIGFVKISKGKVYWFAVKTSEKNEVLNVEELKSLYKNFHPLVNEMLSQTPQGSIHQDRIRDLKLINNWWKDGICLIGDAAHATTPNLGQGACQAIEDGYYLANCYNEKNANASFEKFQKARISKAHQIVKTSWTIGKMAHWKNPFAVKLRNSLMRLTPKKLSQMQSERIYRLT